MTKALVDWSRCFAEKGEDGITKVYDIFTGLVVAVEDVRADGTRDLIPADIAREQQREIANYPVQYSRPFADVICNRIASGGVLKTLCNEPGMPSYAVVCRWSRTYPEFREALIQAEKDRAEGYTDEALQVARDLVDQPGKRMTDVQAATLLTTQLWQKASAGSPKFQSRSVGKDAPSQVAIQVVIETGIRRTGDPGFRVDETERLKNTPDASTQGVKEEPIPQDIVDVVMKQGPDEKLPT